MGAAVPLIISAISAGAQAYETNRVAKNQDEEAAQGIRLQANNQQQADTDVGASVDQLGKSNADSARTTATNDFLGQLRRNRGQAVSGAAPNGSARYKADMAGAESDVNDFGARAADTLARVNAPGIQREAEDTGFNRLATSLAATGRASAGDQFLTQLRMRSIRQNPWVGAGSQFGQGAANGMASRGTAPTTGRPLTRVDTPTSIPRSPYAPRNA